MCTRQGITSPVPFLDSDVSFSFVAFSKDKIFLVVGQFNDQGGDPFRAGNNFMRIPWRYHGDIPRGEIIGFLPALDLSGVVEENEFQDFFVIVVD